jgi:hypothetical protein
MSLQSLLKPETQAQEWSKIYVNELNAEKIVSPEHGSSLVFVRSNTVGAPGRVVGDFPQYQEPDTVNTSSGGTPENFEVLSKGFRVIKSGFYRIAIRASLILDSADGTSSIALLRDGEPDSNVILAQTCPAVNTISLVHINLSDLVYVNADEVMTLGVSSEIPTQTCNWQSWNISATTVSIQDSP